jgi:hypothetical protein
LLPAPASRGCSATLATAAGDKGSLLGSLRGAGEAGCGSGSGGSNATVGSEDCRITALVTGGGDAESDRLSRPACRMVRARRVATILRAFAGPWGSTACSHTRIGRRRVTSGASSRRRENAWLAATKPSVRTIAPTPALTTALPPACSQCEPSANRSDRSDLQINTILKYA